MTSKTTVKIVKKSVTSSKTHLHVKANLPSAKQAAVQGRSSRGAAKAPSKAAPGAGAVSKVLRVTKRKSYTRPQFRRPHTFRTPVMVKPGSNMKAIKNTKDSFNIIRHPLTTDTAMAKIEKNNTLTFIVDPRANKTSIKKAIHTLYNVKTVKINTLIRPDGKKKAYVRLAAAYEAVDVANKINIL